MVSKTSKLAGLAGVHTAGIYSDMTVDGPIIGTLVVIIDRAKNLPNKRTMGKQDPYCAARLGKEAKKTDTDKRGGQTPRWDQELRFTVHDSPDYNNLKMSIFNDDKKTELIGETWITLVDVVKGGGGQSDIWHPLNCKGKYAGEVRVELTYYDTRPKEEEAAAAEKQKESLQDGTGERPSLSVTGPRQQTPVKRRPLPSNPGSASPSPNIRADATRAPASQAVPRSLHTSPVRSQTLPLPGQDEYVQSSQRRNVYNDQQPQPVQPAHPSPYADMRHEQESVSPTPYIDTYAMETLNDDLFRPSTETYSIPNASQLSRIGHPPDPYDQPAVYRPHPDPYMGNGSPASLPRTTRWPVNDTAYNGSPMAQPPLTLPHSNSAPVMPTRNQLADFPHRGDDFYNGEPNEPMSNTQMVRGQYAGDQQYGYDIGHHALQREEPSHLYGGQQLTDGHSYHHSNGYPEHPDVFDQSQRRLSMMQPTVEDEDDLPPPPPVHRISAPTVVQRAPIPIPTYPADMAPAPLKIASWRHNASPGQSPGNPRGHQDHAGYGNGFDDRAVAAPARPYLPSSMSMDTQPGQSTAGALSHYTKSHQHGDALALAHGGGYSPSHAEHSALTRYDSRTNFQEQQQHTPPRAYSNPPMYEPTPLRQSISQQEAPAGPPRYYSNPDPTNATTGTPPVAKPQAISPDFRNSRMPNRSTPTRKSVSPRPAGETPPIERRKSAIPFGPDDYDDFNPNARSNSSLANGSHGGSPNPNDNSRSAYEKDDGPIVDFHGSVVDPSDRLPVNSWAPEPERKGASKTTPVRERERLNGARNLGSGGTRPSPRERVSVIATVNGSPIEVNAARNRLQKRGARPQSQIVAGPASSGSYHGGSPGGYGGGSPGGFHHRGSYSGEGPPPIPAKVPLSDGFGSDDLAALSEEMKTIDIGTSSAVVRSGRNRRF